VSALAGRSGRYLLLYGGTLLLMVVVGAVVAYSERLGGDNGPYVLLVGVLAMTAAGAILLQWRIGAVLLVAALPYETVINFGPLASGMKALALLTFISFALALLTDQKLFERFARLWQQPLTLAVLAFVLWVSASNLWATYQGEALRATIQFLGLFGSMLVIGSLEMRYLALVWACLVFSFALSVPTGYILPVPEDSAGSVFGSDRFRPGGATPNTYACNMEIVLFVAYFGLLRRHRGIANLLVLPIFLYGIFATASRTGLIALLATPLLALFVPRLGARLGWRVLNMYVLGAAAIAVIALAVPSVTDLTLERYATLSQIESEETWNGRWSSWQGALDVIASHPILGVGAGNFAEGTLVYSEKVFRASVENGEIASVAHNIYLGVASELGLVGLVLFLGILFFLFKTAVPIARRSDLGTGILVGLIVFMIAGLTLPWGNHKMVYYLFGSVLALQLHYSSRRAPSSDEQEGSR
jgi:O-antigen ligase